MKELSPDQKSKLMKVLKTRFAKNMSRHSEMEWEAVESRLKNADSKKLQSLQQMEETGGEPDVIGYDQKTGEFIFYDCSPESPKGRRSLCYDREGLESRKDYPPKNTAIDMASEMNVNVLTEDEYRSLQKLGDFDSKTSSWLKAPADVRKLGGAIFGDFRYGNVFIYHNGAQSYYAARGFRASLKL
jgi:hypothetical protein